MDYEQGNKILENAVKGFHGKFKKMYGQIAIRLDEVSYLTTGGNKPLAEIDSEDFELCDLASGDLGELFTKRPDINAIIFGCTEDAVKASETGDSIPATLEDIAMITGASLKIIDDTSTEKMLDALQNSSVCLIRGMGVLAACSNARKAVAAIQLAQKACEAEVHGKLIGGVIALDPADAESFKKSFADDYTQRNEESHVEYVGFDEREFALRNQLIEYGKDLVKKDLSYGSWGNLSVKLNDDEMLITPSAMDYFDIKIEDIVKVNIHTLEYGDQRVPSSEAPMHAIIYRDHPGAGAVIHTHSNAISVFAACEAGFQLKDPQMKELIGDIYVCKYAPAGTDELAVYVAETLKTTHACVIPHHGAVFYGPSLDVVFAISEAVELKARNLLDFDAHIISTDEEDD